MIPTQIKGVIYGTILAVISIAVWYLLYDWHYNPISIMEHKIEILESNLQETGRQLNICEANISKQSLGGYIDCIGENDEEPVIDFSNITY